MPFPVGVAYDFQQNEIRNTRIHNLTQAQIDALSPVAGQVVYNSSRTIADGRFGYYTGSGWVYGTTYTAGNGLVLNGQQFAVNPDGVTLDTGGAQSSVRVRAGGISATQIDGSLKPSISAGAATEALRALGTGPATAAAGNDSRLSDSRPPNGTAGGVLTGTYPNPGLGTGVVGSLQILDDSIVNADINSAAAIARTKLASTGVDVADQQQALAAQGFVFSNDTGSGITGNAGSLQLRGGGGLAVVIDATYASFARNISVSGQRIMGLSTPQAASDAVPRQYVDDAIIGFKKGSVQAATTGAITLSGTQTIDTRPVVAGERVLVKNQGGGASDPANGVWVVAAGAWTRAPDYDTGAKLDGSFIIVEDGTQLGTAWVTTSEVTNVGTDPVAWTQFGSTADLVAGNGLSRAGNTFDVNVDGTTLEINADVLRVKALGISDSHISNSAGISRSKLSSLGVDTATTQKADTFQFASDASLYINYTSANRADFYSGGSGQFAVTNAGLLLLNPINANTRKITSLADGIAAGDAVNRGQMDSLGVRQPVKAAATAPISLTAPGATLDGVTLVAQDRILLTAQADGTANGIYIWTGTSSTLTRALDATSAGSLTAGTSVSVQQGTANAGLTYSQSNVLPSLATVQYWGATGASARADSPTDPGAPGLVGYGRVGSSLSRHFLFRGDGATTTFTLLLPGVTRVMPHSGLKVVRQSDGAVVGTGETVGTGFVTIEMTPAPANNVDFAATVTF